MSSVGFLENCKNGPVRPITSLRSPGPCAVYGRSTGFGLNLPLPQPGLKGTPIVRIA